MNQGSPTGEDVARTLGLDRSDAARRWAWRAVLLAALAGAAWAGWRWWGGTDAAALPAYALGRVSEGPLTVTVSATGTLQPTTEVEISSELSGVVRHVAADHNDRVTAGDVLAVLDTDKLEAEVALARAQVSSARAQIAQAEATQREARAEYERTVALRRTAAASEQAMDKARAARDRAAAAIESAGAALETAQATLKVRETDLAKATIRAPVTGVVLKRAIDPGQTVAASFSAPTLFTLAENLERMELQVDVDEADVALVEAGQEASFTVDAHPGRKFPARITQLRYAPDVTQGVVTYKALLAVDNADLSLRPGMTASAEIVARRIESATLVPNEALRWAPPAKVVAAAGGGGVFSFLPRPPPPSAPLPVDDDGNPATGRVYTLKEGLPHPVEVRLGLSDGTMTVVEGIAPGTEVIVADGKAGAGAVATGGSPGPQMVAR